MIIPILNYGKWKTMSYKQINLIMIYKLDNLKHNGHGMQKNVLQLIIMEYPKIKFLWCVIIMKHFKVLMIFVKPNKVKEEIIITTTKTKKQNIRKNIEYL